MTSISSTNNLALPTEDGTTRSTSNAGGNGRNSGNGGNRRSRNNNRNRSNNNIDQVQLSNPVTYESDISEVGCVLGLKYEKFNNKSSSYEIFLEKVANYVVSNLKNCGNVRPLFTKMIDPTDIFNNKRIPNPFSEKDSLVPL